MTAVPLDRVPVWMSHRIAAIEAAGVECDIQEELHYTRNMDGTEFTEHVGRMRKWYRPLRKQKAKDH